MCVIIDSGCQLYNSFLKEIKPPDSSTYVGTPKQRGNWLADMQMWGLCYLTAEVWDGS